MALDGKDDMLSILEENIAMVLALEYKTLTESLNATQNYEDLINAIDHLREKNKM